tara:strand:- start:1308 stop:2231 length:924 start_codon:yes stop_codon:yes gene_type:complete
MCSKIGKLSAGQTAKIGFGIDAGLGLLDFFTGRKETNRENAAIRRRNQLTINAYETRNRNAELAWRNDKTNSDIEVDNKWRETIDAIAESQLKARQTAGASAIAQQQILAKMMNASAGREQAGRRTGGRANYLALAQQMAAKGAEATFSKDSSILFQDRVGNNLAAFAQGKYVEYITGRPSPAAPPILEQYREGPSFLNTALSIAGAGLNRYSQYKGYTNKPGWNNPIIEQDQNIGGVMQNPPVQNEPSSEGGQLNTMEVPNKVSPIFGTNLLQAELDDYFGSKTTTGWENPLGIDFQDTFKLGANK